MGMRGDERARDVVRWTAGCLVAAAATIGVVILVFLVAIALQPPVWVQVVLGVGLAIGGAALAWLVASAVGQANRTDRTERLEELRRDGERRPTEKG